MEVFFLCSQQKTQRERRTTRKKREKRSKIQTSTEHARVECKYHACSSTFLRVVRKNKRQEETNYKTATTSRISVQSQNDGDN